MSDYQKLLAVMVPDSDKQPALARAIELASKTKAEITAFLPIYDFSYDMTSILSGKEREAMRESVIAEHKAWVDDLIKQIAPAETVSQIKSSVIWHSRPYESIILQGIEGNYDVIVKSTHEHDKLKSVIFTPTDWNLMRKSPVPVLLVKEHDWPVEGKVLCAINISGESDEHQNLNQKIIEHGKALASAFDGQVHLINSYPGTPVNLAIELPDFDAHSYSETIKMQHHQSVNELANQFGIPSEHCHVKEGLPEDIIPDVAEQLDAELVILGTVGRTGFSAALIGNTAEHVIDNINCDLLAIKPEGYCSPLDPNC